MEAGTTEPRSALGRTPAWLLGVLPLLAIAIMVALLFALGGPGLGERSGPPVEELAIENTVLRPGEIELTIRNDGYAPFTATDGRTIGRLGSTTLEIAYPWIEGEAYRVLIVTATGGTLEHEIPVAAETPEADAGFFGLMALLGFYVGVIPVSLGLLWLPFIRRIGAEWLRALIAFTVGLLAFLAVDAALEGLAIGADAPTAFGGTALVFLGALISFLALSGVDSYLRTRRRRAASAGAGGLYMALMVAIGIGLHNLGEGLAIGSAYASGALALGAFLVVGFAIHNTTEGLAIVAPLTNSRPSFGRLVGLGLIAGAPAIVGAWIGAAAYNPSLAALLFGVGVGAILQVIWQLVPAMRDEDGRALHTQAVIGLIIGILLLYLTGLLVSI